MKLWLAIIVSLLPLAGHTQTDELYDPFYYISVLERKTDLQMDSIHTLEFTLKRSKRIMLKEMVHRKTWIKIAVGEAAIITGGILIIASGAWVPVIMGVTAVELFLILEGQYRLNSHDMKRKKPPRWKM
jgi:hypothetical protein